MPLPPCFLRARRALIGVLFCLLFAPLWGQEKSRAHIAYVFPAGGQAGATFRVQVGGNGLKGLKGAVVGDNIGTAKFVEVMIPEDKNSGTRLRKEVEKIVLKDEPNLDVKMLADRVAAYMAEHPEYREKRKEMMDSYMMRQISTDALAEIATFEVTLAADAEPGVYSFTVFDKEGMSNPLFFRVDNLAEFTTPSLREVISESPKELQKSHTITVNPTETTRVFRPEDSNRFEVTLPVIVNGQITIAKPDVFTFTAKKGQRIVIAVWARALIPYISDAVPGWFQPVLSVRNAQGEEVAYCDDFYHEVDPLLMFAVPEDGTYSAEVRDSVSRGREDFVYRMLIGEVPFVTSVYPLGVQAEAPSTLALSGWNLPQSTVSFVGKTIPRQNLNLRPQGFFQRDLSVQVNALASADISRLARDKSTGVYSVKTPIVIDGKIEKPGEKVFLSFAGKKGQRLSAEITARRLGSPFDGFLLLKGPDGKTVASSDDEYDADEGLITQHADPRFICTLPADGTYRLELTDTQNRGGDLFAYRLQLGAPQPDFSLRVTPSNIDAIAGHTAALTVHVTRKGDFKGPVALRVRGLPDKTSFSGMRIPEGVDEVTFTVTLPASAKVSAIPFQVQGVVETQTGRIVRTAIPCENMMQAFYIWHLVPFQHLQMNIMPTSASRIPPWASTVGVKPTVFSAPLVVPRTGTFSLDLGAATTPKQGALVCELSVAPAGLSVTQTRFENGRCIVDIASNEREMTKALPGNLIFNLQYAMEIKGQAGKTRTVRRYLRTLPAIAYTIGDTAVIPSAVAPNPETESKPAAPATETKPKAMKASKAEATAETAKPAAPKRKGARFIQVGPDTPNPHKPPRGNCLNCHSAAPKP